MDRQARDRESRHGKILEFQERLAKSGFWWPTA